MSDLTIKEVGRQRFADLLAETALAANFAGQSAFDSLRSGFTPTMIVDDQNRIGYVLRRDAE